MKVTAFVGSARRKRTYHAVERFLTCLQSLGNVEYEIVALSDYQLETCIGCKQCFEKGEAFCPWADDRDLLIAKLTDSDGVVFASPNYSFQVSAFMKIFLDRIAFIFHRPCFFGKAFTGIVVQGVYGGKKIVDYLDFVGNGLGFNTVTGCCLSAFEPMSAQEEQKIDRTLVKQSKRFYKRMAQPAYPVPTLFKLMAFRMSRTSMKLMLDDSSYDYRYYEEKGWFESDYYYPTQLGAVKKITGNLFDWISSSMTKRRDR